VKPPSWLIDTIARRFALTEILAVAVTLGLVLLFNRFGGVWAQEPLERTGLLNEVADLVRVIETAPPEIRQSVASAATDKEKQVYWLAAGSNEARMLDAANGNDVKARRIVTQRMHRTVTVLEPTSPDSVPPGLDLHNPDGSPKYLLGVRLLDRSWAVFTTSNRSWGISEPARWGIRLFFLAVSISLVTIIAARQFAAPIKALAMALREFGVNPRAPPIPEAGPRELRQVIRTFNEMQGEIQKFVAYRTMMLAAISHDLRTPLTRMRLRGEYIKDPEQQARLFRDVDEMQAMVDGALAFFRDDAVAEPRTTFDLPHVLLTIANDYADQKIEIPYKGPVHAVYQGRPFALKRAFNNLVENAIKYATPPELELLREPQAFVVVVRDRGPGIPDKMLQDVFLPYYRVEKSRNRSTGGVGLGLTVSLAIIQGHGGEIVLRNSPGGGLEARIMLPLANEGPRRAVS
jgi:signal transduction histidine kinase